jgi:hypothetical protein
MSVAVLHAAEALPHLANLLWWRQLHHWVPIGLVGVVSWTVWIVRFSLSRFYRAVPVGYEATTSVVVPSFREGADILVDGDPAPAQPDLEKNWYAAWLTYVVAADHP